MRRRYPQALADGLLRRVRERRELFYGADDILAAAGFALEDDALLGIALQETSRHDDSAEAAASVLGPNAVGRLIDAYLAAGEVVRDASGKYNQAAGESLSRFARPYRPHAGRKFGGRRSGAGGKR